MGVVKVGEQPIIASFVVRLLLVGEEERNGDHPAWRVKVRHVQTGKEVRFLRLSDAVMFMEEAADPTLSGK